MDMKEVKFFAKRDMKGYCRVCTICDGIACAGEVPGMGGRGTGSSFHNNFNALKSLRVNMRLVHDVKNPVTSCKVLGLDLVLPVIAAPIGGVSANLTDESTEANYIKNLVAGCKEGGIIGSTGDGVDPVIHEGAFAAIDNAGGHGIPFIKPWEEAELNEKLEKAFATACPAIGMDIDAAGLTFLAGTGHPVSPKSADELKKIVALVQSKGKKFILKGVMTVEDALAAVDAGVDAIVVSNHGGRVLEHCPGTAEVLPAIAKAVKAKKSDVTVLVDGAVRTGLDILKMLALGADAVMIGRPFSPMTIGGGVKGVAQYVAELQKELEQAMILTGCATLQDAKTVEVLYTK